MPGSDQPAVLSVETLGDSAVLVRLGQGISPAVGDSLRSFCQALRAAAPPWLVAVVPAYDQVAVHYDPLHPALADADILATLTQTLGQIARQAVHAPVSGRQHAIPVCYAPEFGPDLPALAAHAGLSIEEVIARHTAPVYTVHFLGFMPGFPYLGGLDARLSMPRLSTPRLLVPEGSVGIGGEQTGIYPSASPGGWQLIGRTPLRLFDPLRQAPCLLQAGDTLRFMAISLEEYQALQAGQA